MNLEQLKRRLDAAIDILRIQDFYLLKHDVNERSITHRLASHLQYVIGSSYHVDCEYNRNIEDLSNSKRIHVLESKLREIPELSNRNLNTIDIFDDTYAELSIIPDIIVHKRGTNKNNILAIEVKKSTSIISSNYDLEKLKCYTDIYSDVNNLKYKYGAFIKFFSNVNSYRKPEIIWFTEGRTII